MIKENDITNLINNRRSHRKYLDKDIPEDILKSIINCGRSAPFGGKPKPDCQVTEYIVINDKKVKERLALNYEDRQFIKKASVIIAVLANKNNDPKYEEYVLSTALAIENLIISAESFGLGSCILSCFMNHQKHVKDKNISREVLNLPDNIELIALISLGYKDEEEKIPEKVLKSYEEIVHFDKY